MRELTFEEMEQVAGGSIVGKVIEFVLEWIATKTMDCIWDNREAIWNSYSYYSELHYETFGFNTGSF